MLWIIPALLLAAVVLSTCCWRPSRQEGHRVPCGAVGLCVRLRGARRADAFGRSLRGRNGRSSRPRGPGSASGTSRWTWRFLLDPLSAIMVLGRHRRQLPSSTCTRPGTWPRPVVPPVLPVPEPLHVPRCSRSCSRTTTCSCSWARGGLVLVPADRLLVREAVRDGRRQEVFPRQPHPATWLHPRRHVPDPRAWDWLGQLRASSRRRRTCSRPAARSSIATFSCSSAPPARARRSRSTSGSRTPWKARRRCHALIHAATMVTARRTWSCAAACCSRWRRRRSEVVAIVAVPPLRSWRRRSASCRTTSKRVLAYSHREPVRLHVLRVRGVGAFGAGIFHADDARSSRRCSSRRRLGDLRMHHERDYTRKMGGPPARCPSRTRDHASSPRSRSPHPAVRRLSGRRTDLIRRSRPGTTASSPGSSWRG